MYIQLMKKSCKINVEIWLTQVNENAIIVKLTAGNSKEVLKTMRW